MSKTVTETISKTDFCTLVGIRQMANKALEQLDDLAKTAAWIVGEELDQSNYGHTSDWIYDNTDSVRGLLNRFDLSEPELGREEGE